MPEAPRAKRSSPLPLPAMLIVTWLVPGLGHLLLRRRVRAAVFAAVIVVAFAVGLALDGELITPKSGDPLSWLAFLAILGNGALFFGARLLGLGAGVVTSPAFEYGKTFLLTAGMMNLLLLLDVHDIMSGRKDW